MTNQVSENVLEASPQRVLPFLRAIATKAEIRSSMAAVGYTEAEHNHAWELLLYVSGYAKALPPVTAEEDDRQARAAIAELDASDEPVFRRVHAALGRLHPEQDTFVFAGIEPGKGPASVVSVATLLDRLDALESSPERQATREADKAAIATLAQRGIDGALRAKMRGLIGVARHAKLPVPETVVSANDGDRTEKLRELHAWFTDWSDTARAVIRRRDYLVLMGLAKRKRDKSGDEIEDAAVSPSPVSPSNGTTTSQTAPVA